MKSLAPWSAVVVVASITAAAALAWAGKVDGTAVFGLLSTVIGGVIVHAAGGSKTPES